MNQARLSAREPCKMSGHEVPQQQIMYNKKEAGRNAIMNAMSCQHVTLRGSGIQ
jgi:hypothetical protein